MYDVTAIGELLIDFAARDTDAAGYPTMKANPGGAPGNFLAALSKYGLRTAFLGKVGTDAFGGLLINTLKEAGIETKGIRQDSSVFTTLAFVTFDAGGDRSFSFSRKPGADTQLSFEELDLELIDQAKVFHFGTLSLTDEPVRTATKRAVEYARKKGKWNVGVVQRDLLLPDILGKCACLRVRKSFIDGKCTVKGTQQQVLLKFLSGV